MKLSQVPRSDSVQPGIAIRAHARRCGRAREERRFRVGALAERRDPRHGRLRYALNRRWARRRQNRSRRSAAGYRAHDLATQSHPRAIARQAAAGIHLAICLINVRFVPSGFRALPPRPRGPRPCAGGCPRSSGCRSARRIPGTRPPSRAISPDRPRLAPRRTRRAGATAQRARAERARFRPSGGDGRQHGGAASRHRAPRTAAPRHPS